MGAAGGVMIWNQFCNPRSTALPAFEVSDSVVPPAGGASSTGSGLPVNVKRSIAPYKYPREIEFVDMLPRTETGKLQRFKLRTQP